MQGHIKRKVLIDQRSRVTCFSSLLTMPFNQNCKSCCKASPNAILLSVALILITVLISPFIWRVLTTKKGGSPKVIPKLQQMIEDLDPFLRIPADCKIIDEEKLDPRIVLNAFTIPVQVFLPIQNDQFVQQVAVINELTAVVPAARFYAAGGKEIRFACSCDSINTDILTILRKVKFKYLLYCSIIIDPSISGL